MNARILHAFEAISTGVGDLVPLRWRPAVRQNRRWIGAGAAVLIAALAFYALFHSPKPRPVTVHVVPVTVARATIEDVPVSITAIGASQAWTSVTIFAQVSGKLLKVNFDEGTRVVAGQVLAEIDPAPYRAALMQAEGALKRDQALLANARLDLERYKRLLAQNAVSEQVEATQAATVRQDEGTVMLDEGQVAAAKVNLGWCHIASPITGRVGVRLVDPGNLVSASGSVSNTPATPAATSTASPSSNSGSGIVVVNQIQPMAVTFTVPEGQFQRLLELSDGFRKPMAVKAFSQETGALLDTGELRIADNRVDPMTGTVELKARFPNADETLWPGQFVNVQLMLETLPHATTVPVAAVNQGPDGAFLYVVGANKTVSKRLVEVGWNEGETAVIKSGLRAGEVVVTDGQMILKPGAAVRIVDPAKARRRST